MNLRNDIDNYNEKMLKLQFEVSEDINHKLTKGELREKFLKRFFTEELHGLKVMNGILTSRDWQSSQGDFIVLKKDARVGSLDIYDIQDCKLFMEIRSKATKMEYEELQMHAEEIKSRNVNIIVGMFSYAAKAHRKTVLSRYGFTYDKDLDMFNEYEKKLDQYPDVDFYYNLNINYEKDDELPYCVIRNVDGEKILFLQPPVIGNLINVFRGTIE